MASQGLHQTQKQTQSLVLAPQLRQSLKILQAPAMDLRTAILEELQINPLLEELPLETLSLDEGRDDANSRDDSAEELSFDANDFEVLNRLEEDWHDYYAQEAGSQVYSAEDAERRQHFFDSVVSQGSLQEFLMEQTRLADASERIQEIMPYVIGSLDRDGFLTDTPYNIALLASAAPLEVQEAIDLLKTFEPVGIGVSNRRESLLLQLELRDRKRSLAYRILANHYDLLLRRRIPDLAKKLAVDIEQIQLAIEEISTLNPSPAGAYSDDTNRVIEPDVTVFQSEDGIWQVSLNNDYIPRLRINNTYRDLLASGHLRGKEREYIQERIRSGKFLINSIDLRQQTIERITRTLLEYQADFFNEGVSRLHPLTMSQIANEIGVHETTVSRAIANKFIATPWGVYPFKFFFTAGFTASDGSAVSNRSIKDTISSLVDGEDSAKPLSDQEIAHLLEKEGVKVARRTVAKYREELGILPTNLRRRYSNAQA
ncbi:MAG: RNA polymerase factor sigma-54 [Puniceicoccaceae bacterium]